MLQGKLFMLIMDSVLWEFNNFIILRTFKNIKMYIVTLYGKNKNMNRLFLIKNPELFQGERILTKNKDYFEGWYFKNTNKENGISFIPGINIEKNKPKAFVQVITNDTSHFINYSINDFSYSHNPFIIKIGNNKFSKDGIHVDIKTEDTNIKGDIKYTNNKNIDTRR